MGVPNHIWPVMAIHVNAGHDINGNAKRGWVIVNSDGDTIAFVDEYNSGGSLRQTMYRDVKETGRLDITKKQWSELVRDQRDREKKRKA